MSLLNVYNVKQKATKASFEYTLIISTRIQCNGIKEEKPRSYASRKQEFIYIRHKLRIGIAHTEKEFLLCPPILKLYWTILELCNGDVLYYGQIMVYAQIRNRLGQSTNSKGSAK